MNNDSVSSEINETVINNVIENVYVESNMYSYMNSMYNLNHINTSVVNNLCNDNDALFKINVTIENMTTIMKIDTGSPISVISENLYFSLFSYIK